MLGRFKGFFQLFAISATFTFCGHTLGAEIFVNCAASYCQPNQPGGNGTLATPYCRIQDAVESAQSSTHDVVTLLPATCRGDGNRDLSFGGREITVHCQGDVASNCVIDCEGTANRQKRGFLFYSEGPLSVLRAVTITNGYSDGGGGGIHCTTSPTLQNVVVTNCTSPDGSSLGGGIYVESGSPIIEHCTFSGNFAGFGGGMFVAAGADPTVRDCVFQDNGFREIGLPTSYGGGIMLQEGASLEIMGCQIFGNIATTLGGGIGGLGKSPGAFVSLRVAGCTIRDNVAFFAGGLGGGIGLDNLEVETPGTLVIEDSIIANNSAGSVGGGVFSDNNEMTITNVGVFENGADDGAGGIYALSASPLVLTSCTIAKNTTTGFAGGLYVGYPSLSPLVRNSIIWGNSAASAAQILSEGGTISVSYSDVRQGPGDTQGSFQWGTNAFGTNTSDDYPHFADFDGGDFKIKRPTSGPPNVCIDSGDNTLIPQVTLDLDGKPRRINDPETFPDSGNAGTGGCEVADMGAYEFANEALVTFEADGSRYLKVTVYGNDPVALRVEGDPNDPETGCVSGYLTAPEEMMDGDFNSGNMVSLLGSETPIYLTPSEWNGPFGVLYVWGKDIVPDREYTVFAEYENCGGTVAVPSSARTWIWGDLDGSGLVDMDDILLFTNGYIYNCYFDECNSCDPQNCACPGQGECHAFAGDSLPCDPLSYDPEYYEYPYMIIDVDDLLTIIVAISGELEYTPTCTWPCGGLLQTVEGGGAVDGKTRKDVGAVRLAGRESRMRGADVVAVDVMLEELSGLRGVQLAIDGLGPDGAALELVDLTVDEGRADYVFGGGRAVSAVDRRGGRLIAAGIDGAVESGAEAYVGTFVFAGPVMSGPIRMSLRAGDTMFRSGPGVAIEVEGASESMVYGE